MRTKDKIKNFFKWAKIDLIGALEQLRKKYQELEEQNKEQREEIIRLKSGLFFHYFFDYYVKGNIFLLTCMILVIHFVCQKKVLHPS